MDFYQANEAHEQILNEVGRWKVIDVPELYKRLSPTIHYQNFCKRVNKLEKLQLVDSFKGIKNRKYLGLSLHGAGMTEYCWNDYKRSNSLTHDIITSNALRTLLEFKNFMKATTYVNNIEKELDPDGIITAQKGVHQYKLAIEVELTQKSKNRIIKKFKKYSERASVSNVLFIMKSKTIFDFYIKQLKEIDKNSQEGVVLLIDNKLSAQRFEYKNALCWHYGKEKRFEDIFL